MQDTKKSCLIRSMRAEQRRIVHEEFVRMRKSVDAKSKKRRERLERRWENGARATDEMILEQEKQEADENLARLEKEMREELERRRRYKYKTYDFPEKRDVPSPTVLKRDIETLKDKINPDRVELRDTSLKIENYQEPLDSKPGKDLSKALDTGKSVCRSRNSVH